MTRKETQRFKNFAVFA